MAVRTRKMVAVVLETGSATQYTLDTYPGDVSMTGMEAGQTEALPILDRGTFAELVAGDDTFPSFTVTVHHDGDLTDAAAQKLGDMLLGQGKVSADTTTDPGGQAWCLKLVVTVTHPAGGVDTYTVGNARPRYDYTAAADGNTLSLTFDCYRPSGGAAPIVLS
jgi:hypothetical protein